MKVSGTSCDFNTLKPHVSRCLLRQLCKRIVNNPFNDTFFDDQHDEVSLPSPSVETHHIQRFYGALIFVDISGFTALSTRLDIESLTTHINDYFKDMLAIIENFGGDVVKFAGDAMYVVWHAKSYAERHIAVHRALACAKEIVRKCNNRSVSLSPTTSDASTPRRMFKKLSLAQSLLSGHSALERDNECDICTTDDEEATSSAAALSGSYELGEERSPRNSAGSSRRSSVTAEICATKIRRLSMPSQMITSGKNIFDIFRNTEPEVASLNVHIGISTGILAGVDVGARGRSEFFLTGQPLIDVAAAESLAKLGQIVVSQSVYDIIFKMNSDRRQCTTFDCVSTELGCYRIEEPITLSTYEVELQDCSLCDLTTELSSMMSMSGWNVQEEYGQRIMLLKWLSSYVHEAARMQSVIHSRASSPPPSYLNADSMQHSGNGSKSVSCSSSVNGFYEDQNDLSNQICFINPLNEEDQKENLDNDGLNDNFIDQNDDDDNDENNKNIERSFSFDDHDVPDESLLAELRELVVIFIKIDVDVSLSHCNSSLFTSSTSSPSSSSVSSPNRPCFIPSITSSATSFSRPSTPNTHTSSSSLFAERPHTSSSSLFAENSSHGHFPAFGHSGVFDSNDVIKSHKNIPGHSSPKTNNKTYNNKNDDKKFQTDDYGFIIRSKDDNAADVSLHSRLQTCMTILTDTFAEHGGQIGTYSCCEKGNVCVATFGLRGSVQGDNAAAAIESAQTIIICLQAIGLNASIGVASGKVYSGIVGSPFRHEYSIMGPAANLSARLMCAATLGTILCENETRSRDRSHLFIRMPMINAKGYPEPVTTYQPVLSESSRMRLASRRSSYADLYEVNSHSKNSDSRLNRSYNKKYTNMSDDGDMADMIGVDNGNRRAENKDSEPPILGRDIDIDSIVDFLKPSSSSSSSSSSQKNINKGRINRIERSDNSGQYDQIRKIGESEKRGSESRIGIGNESNNVPNINYKSTLSIDVNVRGDEEEDVNKTSKVNNNIIDNVIEIMSEKFSMEESSINEEKEVEKEVEKSPMKIAIVTGACGCGKTSFLGAVRDRMARLLSSSKEVYNCNYGDIVFSGGSNSYDTTVPFNSWRPVLTALFITVSQRAIDRQKEAEKNELKLYEKMLKKSSSQMLLSPSSLNSVDWKTSIEKRKYERRGGIMRDSLGGTPSPGRGGSSLVSVSSSMMMSPCNTSVNTDYISTTHQSSLCGSRHSSGASQSTERSSSIASTFQRLNHLKNGILLITAALPQNIITNLSLVFKLLPSFAKTMKNSEYKVEDSTLVGTAKLTKTVEVLSALIQTAIDLLITKTIFITLDDVQSMDASSWNLLTYMWKNNNSISVLASFHSLSRNNTRGKVNTEAAEIEFVDFNDPYRCKVLPLLALDKAAITQLVARMLHTSSLKPAQVAIITEATIDLAGGNPLFAREITISAVDTFTDMISPEIITLLGSESIAEATLSHVINTLRPRHRIEEIISLRFDRLSPSYQLVLKIASVIAKDGASFTADMISYLIKELSISKAEKTLKAERRNGGSQSNSTRSTKYSPRSPVSSQSTSIANLYSVNVDETLKKILNLNEFIKTVDRSSSRSFYSQNNAAPEESCATVKYKFKNILIKKCIYDLMLNHQKQWSHQKVAEYLEFQAISRLSSPGRTSDFDDENSDNEIEDDTFSNYDNNGDINNNNDNDNNNINNSKHGDNAESEFSFSRMKELGSISIADWNMMGAHWRLSNNLIKAMGCFYESGYLIDQQGDIETAKLLWTEAYEILCSMRKESSHVRESFTSIGLLEKEEELIEKEEIEEKAKKEEEMIQIYEKLMGENFDEKSEKSVINENNKNGSPSKLVESQRNFRKSSSGSYCTEEGNISSSGSELGPESRSGLDSIYISMDNEYQNNITASDNNDHNNLNLVSNSIDIHNDDNSKDEKISKNFYNGRTLSEIIENSARIVRPGSPQKSKQKQVNPIGILQPIKITPVNYGNFGTNTGMHELTVDTSSNTVRNTASPINVFNGMPSINSTTSHTPRRLSIGSVGSKDESVLSLGASNYLSECAYHMFKGDSLALELAITLIIRLSQNIVMFEEQPDDVVNLNNEAFELASCTRRIILENDAITFIHVPRLSPLLFLRNSSLLGPVVGRKERRQSITLKNGKQLFCLRDPSIIFPVLSGMIMRYLGRLLPDDEKNSNWNHINEIFLNTAKDSKIPVHIIRALTLKSLLCFVNNDHKNAIILVEEMDLIFIQSIHSDQLIHIYGADRATVQYSFASMACILIGDYKKAIINYNKADEYLGMLCHLQSVVVTSMMQYVVYNSLKMYKIGYAKFKSFMNYLSINGGHHNMFNLYIPLFEELGKRNNEKDVFSFSRSFSSQTSGADSINNSNNNKEKNKYNDDDKEYLKSEIISEYLENENEKYLTPTESFSPLYSRHSNHKFDYEKLINDSKNCESSDTVPVLLALRYGKGVELLKAELCLSEAKRIYLLKEYSSKVEKKSRFSSSSSTSPLQINKKNDFTNSTKYNSGYNMPKIIESNLENKTEISTSNSGCKNSILHPTIWQNEEEENYLKSSKYVHRKSFQENDLLKRNESEKYLKIIEFCESGIRFIDFSFSFYSINDSTHNSLQCYLIKADLLVMHAIMLEEKNNDEFMRYENDCNNNTNNIYFKNRCSNDNLHHNQINDNVPYKLRQNAGNCLCAALELGVTCNIQLPLILAGVRFIQLKLDEKRGRYLIIDFFTVIINRDRIVKITGTDVNKVVNIIDEEFPWMNNIPILMEAKSLL